MQEASSYSPVEAEKPLFSGMDAVRNLIVERVKALKIDLADASRRIGKNHAYLQQFIKRGVPRHLPETVREALSDLLKVDETKLRGVEYPTRNEKKQSATANARIGAATRLQGTIPVYGHAMGGKDGQFVLNGNKVADVVAPPSLAGVPEAYAVYVVGDSMAPRYFAGETVFVNPRLPVRKDDFVVAQIAAGGAPEGDAPLAYVKRFVSMDANSLKLAQYNPPKTLKFPRDRVVSVHRIIMGGDG